VKDCNNVFTVIIQYAQTHTHTHTHTCVHTRTHTTHTHTHTHMRAHTCTVTLHWSPANMCVGHELMATASRDRLIHVFNAKDDYQFLQTMDEHSAAITSVKFACWWGWGCLYVCIYLHGWRRCWSVVSLSPYFVHSWER